MEWDCNSMRCNKCKMPIRKAGLDRCYCEPVKEPSTAPTGPVQTIIKVVQWNWIPLDEGFCREVPGGTYLGS